MKTHPFNINDTVKVKLTKRGRAIRRANYDKLASLYNGKLPFPYRAPKEDKGGWSEWQMWELMQEFGQHITMGGELPFETTIRIPL